MLLENGITAVSYTHLVAVQLLLGLSLGLGSGLMDGVTRCV